MDKNIDHPSLGLALLFLVLTVLNGGLQSFAFLAFVLFVAVGIVSYHLKRLYGLLDRPAQAPPLPTITSD